MKDKYNREIDYLRLSVTGNCNLRCGYCMGNSYSEKTCFSQILSRDEIIESVRACSELGIRKVRITGGEPLVRSDILSICEGIGNIEGIEEVCLTTNGTLLSEFARNLKLCGINRLNISLDTLDKDKYIRITGQDRLDAVLQGIESAISENFDRIKINCVLLKGINDDEIADLAKLTLKHPVDVRFIELMPMVDTYAFSYDNYMNVTEVLNILPELIKDNSRGGIIDGVADNYIFPEGLGRVGLISPISNNFCSSCNRIRITYDGFVKPCLHSKDELCIKGLSLDEKKKVIEKAINLKPPRHGDLGDGKLSSAKRSMNRIGG